MYIYKMVFTERENFTREEYEKLYDNGIVMETDYGTTEIMRSSLEDIEDELRDILVERVGSDVIDLLERGGLDIVLVV